jgi:hypothetical protein
LIVFNSDTDFPLSPRSGRGVGTGRSGGDAAAAAAAAAAATAVAAAAAAVMGRWATSAGGDVAGFAGFVPSRAIVVARWQLDGGAFVLYLVSGDACFDSDLPLAVPTVPRLSFLAHLELDPLRALPVVDVAAHLASVDVFRFGLPLHVSITALVAYTSASSFIPLRVRRVKGQASRRFIVRGRR